MTTEMWGEGKTWKTKSAFLSWVRGGVRRSLWSKHPVKLDYIKKHRQRIPNPNPKGKVKEVWGGRCELCNLLFVQSQLEVDHISGNHSLKDVSDIQSFIESIVFVSEDDLQMVCKGCHKCKSYSDKVGISFEEAVIEKKVIAAMGMKVTEQKDKLFEAGFTKEQCSTKDKRRECFRELYRRSG